MVSSNPAEAPAPRKRGRPRTVTGDQDVPEVGPPKHPCIFQPTHYIQKRRTQLRVAQQAYRKRKENTISNLQSRVQELEGGIENFSQSFLSFSNLLLEAHVLENHPDIASSLQFITQECVALAQQGSEDGDEKVNATPPQSKRHKPNTPPPSQDAISDKELDLFREYNIYEPAKSVPSFISKDQFPKMSRLPASPRQTFSDLPMLPFEVVLGSELSPPTSHSSPESMTPPETIFPDMFAMQEELWTLSHRIVRECCRKGYILLAEQYDKTEKIAEIFGQPLSVTERNRKITAFLSVVNDTGGDAVELRANVIESVKRLRERVAASSESYANVPRSWKRILDTDADEWLDANGVQKLLFDKGLLAEERGLPNNGIVLTPHARLNVAAFISGMLKLTIPYLMNNTDTFH